MKCFVGMRDVKVVRVEHLYQAEVTCVAGREWKLLFVDDQEDRFKMSDENC